MSELLSVIADDIKINPYKNEPIESYGYRIIYSSLGLWCLKAGLGNKDGVKGISKNSQTSLLHNLSEIFLTMCEPAKHYIDTSRYSDIAVFIRNIYEQTGYLLTLDNNHNTLNNTSEAVKLSETDYLFLGLPLVDYQINGLGIHCSSCKHEIMLHEFLVRDSLTPEDYLRVNFDECDFEKRNFELNELEFFNPFFYGNMSNSWIENIKSDMTMARKSPMGPYYRVIKKEDGSIIYADDNNNASLDRLTGAEFRRLYVALKKFYDNPMQVLLCPIDEEYSYIRILGQMPNREYYFILMNAWPKNSFNDRKNFIIRNELTEQVLEVLRSIGFTVRNGEFYG